MNIVFVAPSIKTGGGNRVFIELANCLSEDNNVRIVYPYNSDEKHTFAVKPNVKFVKIGKLAVSKVFKIVNMVRCVCYLNRLDATHKLIISDPIFCLLIPFFSKKQNIYRFIQADDYRIYDDGLLLGKGFLYKLYKWLAKKSYHQHINYIFNSLFVYKNYCYDAQRVDVPFALVHPAIDHEVFNKSKQEANLSTGVSICLIGRKHPWKGSNTFINVFKNLSREERSRIQKVVVMSHDDMSSFDMQGIEFLKPSCDSEIAQTYQSSEIFISTSWWEGFGLPPLEAMACGCAVICSDSGGVNEFARPNENCLMFSPKNESELKSLLMRLIDNENLRKTLSLQGVETAKKFTWKASAEQFLKIIS